MLAESSRPIRKVGVVSLKLLSCLSLLAAYMSSRRLEPALPFAFGHGKNDFGVVETKLVHQVVQRQSCRRLPRLPRTRITVLWFGGNYPHLSPCTNHFVWYI